MGGNELVVGNVVAFKDLESGECRRIGVKSPTKLRAFLALDLYSLLMVGGAKDWFLERSISAPITVSEDVPLVLSISPIVYLVKDIDGSIREVSGLVLFGIRMEWRVFGVR